jgi:hypothetical protein
MTHALIDGIQRVSKAPAVLVGVYVITLLAAAPLSIIMHDAIATDLGSSIAADDVAFGVNWDWWEEFQSRATGIARTFNPRIIGFAAVLQNQSNLVDNQLPRIEVILTVVAYLGVWMFLVGGIIDRLARQRRIATVGFFAACGTFFFRFCRLGLLAGVAYWIVFETVHTWLFETLYDAATENLVVERTAFLIRIGLYATLALLLLPINMVFDYAKVRAVVEDRHSMAGAVLAAIRFIWRRPQATVGLYLLNSGLFLAVLAAYAILAPSPSGGAVSMWIGFAVGQAYVVARLFMKLVFYASQTSFFQSQLAHSEYVATPSAVWPDSPAAEAVSTVS